MSFLNPGVVLTDPTNSFSVGFSQRGNLWIGNLVLGDEGLGQYQPLHPSTDSNYIQLFEGGTGFWRKSDNLDPLATSAPADTWGVSNPDGAAWTDYPSSSYPTQGIISALLSAEQGSATSVVRTSNNMQVTHRAFFIAANVVAIQVSVTNNGTPGDVLYQRNIDWDLPPTQFSERVFTSSITNPIAPITDSTFFGFENPDPRVNYFFTAKAGGNWGPGDFGGGIKLKMTLGTGQTANFTFFYAVSTSGQKPDALLSQVAQLGAQYSVVAMSSESGSSGAYASSAATDMAAARNAWSASYPLLVQALAAWNAQVTAPDRLKAYVTFNILWATLEAQMAAYNTAALGAQSANNTAFSGIGAGAGANSALIGVGFANPTIATGANSVVFRSTGVTVPTFPASSPFVVQKLMVSMRPNRMKVRGAL